MRRLAACLAVLGACVVGARAQPVTGGGVMRAPAVSRVSVCFVPETRCAPLIVAAIAGARSAIRVQAYGFTSPSIVAALADARRRGVDVEVILDKSNDRRGGRPRRSGAVAMARAGVPVWIDERPAIAHSKVIIIDNRLVIGGSFNYTDSADRRNAENVTFSASADLAEAYARNWSARRAVSRPYVEPMMADRNPRATRGRRRESHGRHARSGFASGIAWIGRAR